MEKDNFAIEGMVCASCAQTVEKAVAQLPDVTRSEEHTSELQSRI